MKKVFLYILCLLLSAGGARAGTDTTAIIARIGALVKQATGDPDATEQQVQQIMQLSIRYRLHNAYARTLDAMGLIRRYQGKHDQAIAYHLQSLRISDSLSLCEEAVNTLINIGSFYSNSGRYAEAHYYYNTALAKVGTDTSGLVRIWHNIAVLYDYEGDQPRAIQLLLYVIPIMERRSDKETLAHAYHSLAVAYGMTGNYKMSETYELKTLSLEPYLGPSLTIGRAAISLASLYIDSRRADAAVPYLEKGRIIAQQFSDGQMLLIYYINAANLAKITGKEQVAIVQLEKYIALKDSISSASQQKLIAETEARYKLEKKEQELNLLRTRDELAQEQLRGSRLWFSVLAVAILLLASLTVAFIINSRLKTKAATLLAIEKRVMELEKERLQKQNQLLQKENIFAQFETLKNQVNPHFLFNSFTALASLIPQDEKKALAFTNEFSNLFRSILEIKDKHVITLQEELKLVNSYLYLQKIRFDESLRVDMHIAGDLCNRFLPPFSLQLLVENAVKHNIITREKPLAIFIGTEDGWLVVKNNLQQRKNAVYSTNTGLQNIKSRYSLVSDVQPEFIITDSFYIARLPLISDV